MKKHFFRSIVSGALVALTLATAQAEPATATTAAPATHSGVPLEITFQVVRVPAAHVRVAGAKVFESAEWHRFIDEGQVQVLDSQTEIAESEKSNLMHIGGKIPETYFDPRAGMSQVQYFDEGLKMDVRASQINNQFKVDAAVERATLTGEGGDYPSSDILRSQTMCLLHSGEVGVVSACRGKFAIRFLKTLFPTTNISEDDTLELAVSVRKL